MFGIVHDGIGGHQEMAVIRNFVLHESAMLEMGIEGLFLFQIPVMEAQHIQLVVNMFEDNLYPPTGEAIEVVRLLGLRGIVEWPFQPTIIRTLVAPLVTASIVTILIEKGDFAGGKSILIVLVAINLFHKIVGSVIIVPKEGKMTPT